MKISNLLLIIIAAILFACGKDDDPAPPSAEGLPGAWSVTAIAYEGTTTTNVDGAEVKADFTGIGKDMDLTVTFKEDPATFTSAGNYTIVLTTMMMGQPFQQEVPFEGFLSNGTWALDGNVITVSGPNGPQQSTIIEQTSTTLKMEWNFTSTRTQQGVTSEMDVHGIYTFRRK